MRYRIIPLLLVAAALSVGCSTKMKTTEIRRTVYGTTRDKALKSTVNYNAVFKKLDDGRVMLRLKQKRVKDWFSTRTIDLRIYFHSDRLPVGEEIKLFINPPPGKYLEEEIVGKAPGESSECIESMDAWAQDSYSRIFTYQQLRGTMLISDAGEGRLTVKVNLHFTAPRPTVRCITFNLSLAGEFPASDCLTEKDDEPDLEEAEDAEEKETEKEPA